MLTASRLRRLISYNRTTGIMRWLVRPSNRIRVGSEAGSARRDGFRKVAIDGRSYLQHRLIIFHQTERWPSKPVIFRNGKRADTRWRNLRVA
jgi:hypothetical protein